MLSWFHWLVSLMSGGVELFYRLTHSYGLAVILLTVAVRLVVMPVYMRQMQSLRKMQLLAPKVKEIQAKYKDDPQKQNQAIMQLYRDENVNIAAGCLPTLIQLPFLWALYDALVHYPFGDASAFLWLHSLKARDPYYILPVLAGATTYWQMRMTTPAMGGDRTQQLISTLMMPVFFFYLSLRFPAGLSLYWVVSNLFSIAQQYLTFGRTGLAGGSAAPQGKA